jgi:dGTPase
VEAAVSDIPEYKCDYTMISRINQEKREKEILSPLATKSADTKGRMREEEPCPLRTEFQRDRDRIIHSKAFRRLMHKTQVFLHTESDHFRTRLTHTLEVAQVARTIARGLNLNEDLTEAIALGHDLGHTPFGHSGEAVLNKIHPGGFRHNEQSLRVVDLIESTDDRIGMNLTFEVRDGIVNHSGPNKPLTPEGYVVRLADRIAYINHDIDDAIRGGVISLEELPKGPIALFGERHSTRIDNMVTNAIFYSDGKIKVSMDPDHMTMMDELRNFMFSRVYNSREVKHEEDQNMVEKVIEGLYRYFSAHPEEIRFHDNKIDISGNPEEMAKDYVAGMTDRFAGRLYAKLFIDR